MPFDPHQRDVDRQVDASMRIFEQAHVGPVSPVGPIRPQRVMACLDGSGQDAGGIAAADFFSARMGCETLVLDACERKSVGGPVGESVDESVDEYVRQRIASLREPQVVRFERGDAYDRILAAVEAEAPELVIVPCPFGRDFESVGADSTGTVIDVLLSRCTTPMLVIRRGDQPLQMATRDIALVVSGASDSAAAAAGWAIGMAADDATVTLNVAVEEGQLESLRELLQRIAPEQPVDREQFEEAMTKAHARLHAATAKAAAEAGLSYRLHPHMAEPTAPALQETPRPRLIVLPLEQGDRYSYGFVQDRIRRSPHPVLVVPSRGRRDAALG